MRIRYQALGTSGEIVKGIVDADSLGLALSQLRRQGIAPFEAEPEVGAGATRPWWPAMPWTKPGTEWRARMVRQLATLLAAGVTLDRALRIIELQTPTGPGRTLMGRILGGVISGLSLSSAIAGTPSFFKSDELGLIRAGEQTGSLVPVLAELAAILERRLETSGKLTSALIYPLFLLAMAPLSLLLIATVLVPNIAPLFANSGAEVPLILRAMMFLSSELRERAWFWIAGCGFFGIVPVLFLGRPRRRQELKGLLLKLPIARAISRQTEASRVCRTLGSLLKGGASLQSAMMAVADVATTEAGRLQLHKARDAVADGKRVSIAMKALKSLDDTALQLMSIGEETNRLEAMLHYIAESEEKAAERYVDRLMTILTPLLTLLMGIMVGGIVMSIMRAILSLNDMALR